MTQPHRGAQTISNGMMKTSHQFHLVVDQFSYHKLLHRHLPSQIKRAIENSSIAFVEVFS